jgi:hypothetical protein
LRLETCHTVITELPARLTLEFCHPIHPSVEVRSDWHQLNCEERLCGLSQTARNSLHLTVLLPPEIAECGPGRYEVVLTDEQCNELCRHEVMLDSQPCIIAQATVKQDSYDHGPCN